jgi:hypothetical protein
MSAYINCAVPFLLPSSGTIGTAGALSGITAVDFSIFPVGVFCIFPAGAVFAGSAAGAYYTVMLTSTTGTVYNNQYTGPGVPTIPYPLIPITVAGGGAYTTVVATGLAAFSVTLPVPGNIGNYSQFRTSYTMSHPNSAGSKSVATSGNTGAGVVSIGQGSSTTSRYQQIARTYSQGGTPGQINSAPTAFTGIGTSANPVLYYALDLTQTLTLSVTLSISTATDWVMVNFYLIELFP